MLVCEDVVVRDGEESRRIGVVESVSEREQEAHSPAPQYFVCEIRTFEPPNA